MLSTDQPELIYTNSAKIEMGPKVIIQLVILSELSAYSVTPVCTFGTTPKSLNFWLKPNLRRMSYFNIWRKMKLAKIVQIVVFSAKTEFRLVSK